MKKVFGLLVVSLALAGCGESAKSPSPEAAAKTVATAKAGTDVEAAKTTAKDEEDKAMAAWATVLEKMAAGCKANYELQKAKDAPPYVVYRVGGSDVKKTDSLTYPFKGTVDIVLPTRNMSFPFNWDKANGKWVLAIDVSGTSTFLESITQYVR